MGSKISRSFSKLSESNKARLLFKEGKYTDSLSIYLSINSQESSSLSPKSLASLYSKIAFCHANLKQQSEALSYFEKSKALAELHFPENSEFLSLINNEPTSFHTKRLINLQKNILLSEETIKIIISILSLLLKSFHSKLKSFFSPILHFFYEIYIKTSSTDLDKLNSLCVFCDYIENTSDLSLQILQEFIKNCYNKDPNIRHISSYALKICAEKCPDLFLSHLNQSIEALKFILNLENASKDFLVSSETAVNALAKILFLFNLKNFELWVKWLPLTCDESEACETHEIFLKNFENGNVDGDDVSLILNALKNCESRLLNDWSKCFLNKLE